MPSRPGAAAAPAALTGESEAGDNLDISFWGDRHTADPIWAAGCRERELHLAHGAGGPVSETDVALLLFPKPFGLSRRGGGLKGRPPCIVTNMCPSVPKSMGTAEQA